MKNVRHYRGLAVIAGVMLVVGALWHFAFAAADYDTQAQPFRVITVVTGSVKNVLITGDDYTIVHLNIQNDGTTASAATDQVIVMMNRDFAGTAVTMSADLSDGVKLPLLANSAATINGNAVAKGADGAREIQLQAVGHGAKVLLIRGRQPVDH